MKKFITLFFCFAFICACGKKQDLQKELLGGQKDEQQVQAAMEFLMQETQVPPQEVKAEKEQQPAVKTEQKTETKTSAAKNTKTTAAKTTAKQNVKTEQPKQETTPATETKPQTEQAPKETQVVQYDQLPDGEKTIELFLDPNNLPKEILKTKDGRLTHPWYFMNISTAAPEGVKPAWFGEELNFKLSWSFVTAGEATITANKLLYNGKEYAYQIETLAKSYPVIDKMFKVRDINMSWIKSDLSKSLGYWQSVREGSYKRDEWLNFDYKNNMFTMYKLGSDGTYSKFLTRFTGADVFDILSALYHVRDTKIPLDKTLYFDVVNVNTQYPLKVVVHGKEKVKTKAGTFNCIVVEPMISGDSIFVSKGNSLKVWLTDDEYRMPVKMTVEVFIGSVKAELYSYKRGTNL